jgi:hypothetical protein
MTSILPLRRLRQEDLEFQANLGQIERGCLKKEKENNDNKRTGVHLFKKLVH